MAFFIVATALANFRSRTWRGKFSARSRSDSRTGVPPMAARLRHIAISVPDPDKAAKFFEEAFGMKIAGRAGVGLYVTDGTINVALLRFPGEVPGFSAGHYGLIHFGMW